MIKPEIILVGGGGHCKACIDVIEQEYKYKIIGILDLPEKIGSRILGYKVIGNDEDIPEFIKQGKYFLITVGHLGNPKLRIKLFDTVKKNNGSLPVIISPLAYVSRHSKIGEGTIIMHHVLINADVQIGNNCIINNKALVEHDSIIKDDIHISTDVKINGGCFVGSSCFVGSGTVLNHEVRVESSIIIGSGSVLRKSIVESGIYAGNPLKKYK